MDISSIDYLSPESEEKTTQQMKHLAQMYQKNGRKFFEDLESQEKEKEEPKSMEVLSIQNFQRPSFFTAARLLTKRTYANLFRSPDAFTRVIQAFSLGFLISICWLRLSNDQYGIQNRVGFLYQSLSLPFIGLLNAVTICTLFDTCTFIDLICEVPTERNVFYKERSDGMYGTGVFYFAYQAVELPLNLFGACLFSVISYFVLGMRTDPGSFFLFTFIIFLLLVQGETFGIMMCGLIYNAELATSVASVFVSIFGIMAGFLRPVSSLPWVLRVLNYALVFQYSAEILGINEFKGMTFTCDDSQRLPDGSCPISTGDQVLDIYTFDPSREWIYLGILCALVVSYRFVAYVVLKYRSPPGGL